MAGENESSASAASTPCALTMPNLPEWAQGGLGADWGASLDMFKLEHLAITKLPGLGLDMNKFPGLDMLPSMTGLMEAANPQAPCTSADAQEAMNSPDACDSPARQRDKHRLPAKDAAREPGELESPPHSTVCSGLGPLKRKSKDDVVWLSSGTRWAKAQGREHERPVAAGEKNLLHRAHSRSSGNSQTSLASTVSAVKHSNENGPNKHDSTGTRTPVSTSPANVSAAGTPDLFESSASPPKLFSSPPKTEAATGAKSNFGFSLSTAFCSPSSIFSKRSSSSEQLEQPRNS